MLRRFILPAAGGLALAAAMVTMVQPTSAHTTVTSFSGALNGVSAVSPASVWAVGYDAAGSLIVRWNGTSWSQVTSPSLADATLNGVSMVSPTDGWAVGSYLSTSPSDQFRFLILHWNGSTWTQAPTPAPDHGSLSGVSMDSASNGWAVGVESTGQGGRAIALHWNGTDWVQVQLPGAGAVSDLFGVSAASATDAWAVGTKGTDAMAVHWNGTGWTQVSTPTLGTETSLSGASDASPSDAWAVGFYGYGENLKASLAGSKTFTLHWNGHAWQREPAPSPGQGMPSSVPINELAGVAVTSSSNVWSVGDYTVPTNAGQAAMTVRWNGSKWAQVANPGGTVYSLLSGISMLSASDGWAVGRNDSTDQPIILHWNGKSWAQS